MNQRVDEENTLHIDGKGVHALIVEYYDGEYQKIVTLMITNIQSIRIFPEKPDGTT